MQRPWIRRLAIALGALLALLAIGAGVLVASFDGERVKSLAIDWMQRERDRTLVIDGPVELSLLPRLELQLQRLRLSEPGRPGETFVAVGEAGLALELLPLLRRQLVVERVRADGVRLQLLRDANGVRNTDDLLPPPAPPGAAPGASAPTAGADALRLDIGAIALRDLRVQVRDALAGVRGEAVVASLDSGRIGGGVASPLSVDARLDFGQPLLKGTLSGRTQLAADPGAGSVALSQMQLAWRGDAFALRGLELQLGGAASWDGRALSARELSLTLGGTLGDWQLAGSRLGVAELRYDPAQQQLQLQALKLALAGQQAGQPLKLTLDWPTLQAGASSLSGSPLSGSVALAGPTRLDASFRSAAPSGSFEQLKLPALALTFDASAGPRRVKGSLDADLTLQPGQRRAALDALQLQADVSEPGAPPLAVRARGKAGAGADAANWTLAGTLNEARFDLGGNAAFGGARPLVKAQARFDALDLNRLLPPDSAASAPTRAPAPSATPRPLDALNALDGRFTLNAGALAWRQYRIADLQLDATLAAGRLELSRLGGRAWGGRLDASGSADAGANRLALKLAADGIDANALLKDVAGKDLLEGRGRVGADLKTHGAGVDEWRSRLAGSASLQLRDGAVKGFNLARALRQAKAALSLRQDAVAEARATEKTDFSELSASARIADGVARSDDLQLKSPFLRVGGAGSFDVGRGRIDYLAKASVTDTSKGQGGAELEALRGITVPVRLSGPFDAIDWQIQWSGVAAAALENRLKDKLSERLGLPPAGAAASAPAAPSPKDAVKDQLKEKLLRGLFK